MTSNFFSRCSLFRKIFLIKSSQRITSNVRYGTNNYEWNKRRIFFPLICLTGLICCDEYRKRHWHLLPIVSAAKPTHSSSLKGNREKFNFIANVVDHIAPAVVYIEIKDLRMKDYVTRFVHSISHTQRLECLLNQAPQIFFTDNP